MAHDFEDSQSLPKKQNADSKDQSTDHVIRAPVGYVGCHQKTPAHQTEGLASPGPPEFLDNVYLSDRY